MGWRKGPLGLSEGLCFFTQISRVFLEPYVYVYFFLNGIANATRYFLLASVLSLIFGLLGIFNLAHGAFFMIGAYVSFQVIRWNGNFWLSTSLPPWL
jgi:branched-subunit amino acid ABC-type transport system permease component